MWGNIMSVLGLDERSRWKKEFEQIWDSIDSVKGWMSPGQEEWLFNAVSALPDGATILEVGSFMGRSTVSMAYACRGTGKRIVAVDTFCGNEEDFVRGKNAVAWEGEDFFAGFIENLSSRGLEKYVIPLRGHSHEVGRIWSGRIDMLFLDGSHEYEDVKKDFELFYPWVREGGVIAMHDVIPEWEGVLRVWSETVRDRLGDIGNVGSLAYGRKLLGSSHDGA